MFSLFVCNEGVNLLLTAEAFAALSFAEKQKLKDGTSERDYK